MSILGAALIPHPPLIIPEVGRGHEKAIQNTIDACKTALQQLAALQPDTVIISSPHTMLYADYFHLSPGKVASGTFAEFGAPQVKISCAYDQELVRAIASLAEKENLPAGTKGERRPELDHATLIPLYFLRQYWQDYKVIRVGLSGLSLKDHYRLGNVIAAAVKNLGRRAIWLASGDLSHKLKEDGPYGFDPAGPRYDKKLMEIMSKGQFDELFSFTEKSLEAAAECGHRSFTMMAGAFDKQAVISQKLSYEGPFGVGYGVCLFLPGKPDESRAFAQRYDVIRKQQKEEQLAKEDSYVRLVRSVIEHYVKTGGVLQLPETLEPQMRTQKAGVFVSLKERGALRGCIGTIGPMYENVAEEIRRNAIAACSRDPRFTPVMPAELDDLEYSVDVLGPLEWIDSPAVLDVKRYGVLVTKGSRSGLLLPNLEGVNTVEQQLDIARQKAGIGPEESGCTLHRFEVIRHE